MLTVVLLYCCIFYHLVVKVYIIYKVYICIMKKIIDIPRDIIDLLAIKAIKSGKTSVKNFIEFILIQEANKK